MNELEVLKRENKFLKDENSRLQGQILEMQANVQAYHIKFVESERKLTSAHEENFRLLKQIPQGMPDGKPDDNRSRFEVEKLKEKIWDLERQLEEKEHQLRGEFDNWENRYSFLSQKRETVSNFVQNYENIALWKKRGEEAEKRVERLTLDLELSQKSEMDLRKENDMLRHLLSENRALLQNQDLMVKNLKTEYESQSRNDMIENVRHNAELRKERDEAQRELEMIKAQIENLHDEKQKLLIDTGNIRHKHWEKLKKETSFIARTPREVSVEHVPQTEYIRTEASPVRTNPEEYFSFRPSRDYSSITVRDRSVGSRTREDLTPREYSTRDRFNYNRIEYRRPQRYYVQPVQRLPVSGFLRRAPESRNYGDSRYPF